jgi:hypothetical protein
LSPLLAPTDKLFESYYNLPYINYTEWLYEHNNIETDLNQGVAEESNERAWSVCQFGVMMMQCTSGSAHTECGQNRKCQCSVQVCEDQGLGPMSILASAQPIRNASMTPEPRFTQKDSIVLKDTAVASDWQQEH